MIKQVKLYVHQKNFSEADLIINLKDYQGAKEGDIVEIYHPEDIGPRLLLQITALKDDLLKVTETISVEQSIANTFQLRTYADVLVRIVSAADVALDSVEITFKDQYMGRSEMWRIKNSLVNTCVYMNKKLEFCMGAIRCQVYEMWSQGDRVACGVITEDTKIVFRSSTSMVYLFLQMSSEMWDFDIHGDLYFEKAVNGFLTDLFTKWKKHGSNHEVTIVLFSRTFYKANSVEEFPLYMRECLQLDYRGRYYEDFYRVVIQNERFDDWSPVLVQLRRLFSDYQRHVLNYHDKPGVIIPTATNSTAAQGNFLEVLNMSLNVFEKHYLERSLERTGQLSVVITPGVGVFEVDRELTNVTKQRIIDNGVGSDLVCVGEQPLHAVPLLKFHNKDTYVTTADDYSMPHWINLSFYSTNKKVAYSNFIPRIKLPPKVTNTVNDFDGKNISKTKLIQDEDQCIHNSFFDYDAYDAQVFQLPSTHGTSSLQRSNQKHNKKMPALDNNRNDSCKSLHRKMSDPDIHHGGELASPGTPKSQAISIPTSSYTNTESPLISPILEEEKKPKPWTTDALDGKLSPPCRAVVGSAGSPPPMGHIGLRPSRALINPFDPSHVTIKLTSNRRRWTHIFPKGPTGVLIQQHHYQAVPTNPVSDDYSEIDGRCSSPAPSTIYRSNSQVIDKKRNSMLQSTNTRKFSKYGPQKSLTLLWGATGEQEWTPALTTGVDWKSLTIPACLPITTDFFPDKRALQNDYLVSDYNLLPDDVNADFAQQRAHNKKPLTTKEVFKELISQRLAHGFQLIILPTSQSKVTTNTGVTNNLQQQNAASSIVGARSVNIEPREEYLLSIGRIFHKISLCGNAITVTRYRPRHPYPPFDIHYRYRFHAPHHDTYEVSWVSFTTEKLENYSWNYLDHYICTRGDTDYNRFESLKYWRFRVYLLPLTHPATRKILDGYSHCDIYTPQTDADNNTLIEGFLRFMETYVNRVKRPNTKKNPRATFCLMSGLSGMQTQQVQRRYSMSIVTPSSSSQNAGTGNSPFRERLGSNRLPEKPRPRSSSKVERGRVSPATEAVLPVSPEAPTTNNDDTEEGSNTVTPLKATSNFQEILLAMCHSVNGIGFLLPHPNLPKQTFVSADAVYWLMGNVEGLTNIDCAVEILSSMVEQTLICHASGDQTKNFVFGFYLYYVVKQDEENNETFPIGDQLQVFENEWMEVEIKDPKGWGNLESSSNKEASVPHFLCETLQSNYLHEDVDNDITPLYRHSYLETDITLKSDRVEWGHARYQSVYRPDQPYELVVQWLTSSAAIISDLVFGWARKAQACGLQMIPIPADLLALPFTNKSDPLRGPIFIPLNIDCLLKNKQFLFEEFREDTWSERLFLFQESIVAQFGFMACSIEMPHINDSTVIHDHQYVHRSGNVFVLIPSVPTIRPRQRSITAPTQRRNGSQLVVQSETLSSPHHAYITRHVSGKNKDDFESCKKVGFLWSWNHMLSRRWRSSYTPAAGDDTFQTNMLRDFREFCNNTDGRLKHFWDKCWEIKENASIK